MSRSDLSQTKCTIWYGFFDFLKREKSKEELDFQNQVTKIDEAIHLMEVSEIRQMVMALIGKSPKGQTYDGDGRKHEIKDPIERKEWEWWIDKYFEEGDITPEQISEYMIRHNIKRASYFRREKHGDEDDEEESDYVSKELDFENLIETIEHDFKPEKVFDEKELQNLLRQFLQDHFPDSNVEREFILSNRDSIDIVVNSKYGFECKIPENRKILRDLIGQLEEYKDEMPNMCAVIVDDPEKNLTSEILDYCKKYEKKGIKTIHIEASKRGSNAN